MSVAKVRPGGVLRGKPRRDAKLGLRRGALPARPESPLGGTLSPRLASFVNALPLKPGLRVLEIGCGPGAAARAVAARLDTGYILAIDRSAKAIALARTSSRAEIRSGRMGTRQVAIEDFELQPGEPPYDLAFAIRVGALDGRHPEAGKIALGRIAAALKPGGRLFIDGGAPLREIAFPYRVSTKPRAAKRPAAKGGTPKRRGG